MADKPENRGNLHRYLGELDVWTRQYREAALEPDLPIVDAHHHLWNDQRGRYMLEELSEDVLGGHNVVATVYIETGSHYRTDGPLEERPIGEVEYVARIAAASASGSQGPRLCAGIVGHADMRLGERAQPILESLVTAGAGRLRGIRHGLAWDLARQAGGHRLKMIEHQALDATFQKGMACLKPLDLSFEAWLYFTQLPDLVQLLRAFPDTIMILNHVGGLRGGRNYGNTPEGIFDVWRGHIRALAHFPNLYCKLGGLGMPSCGWEFHLREVPPSSQELAAAWRPFVETCIEAFGPERCIMESNFPPDKQSSGYVVLWNALKRITSGYSAAEKRAMYHDTAVKVYRLKL